MVSIKDIADRAGVSVATVSRVINNKGYISEKTREKVMKYVEELNYIPNELARSLNNKSSKIVGLMIPTVEMPFFSELTYAIERAAHRHDYKILLCNSEVDTDKEKGYINMLKRNQVAGIIMASQNMHVEDYKDIDYPVVMIERSFSADIPYVISDNYNGGMLATTHLIERGCRFIGHLAGRRDIKPANKRTDAYLDVVKEHNIPHVIAHSDLGFDNLYDTAYRMLENHPELDGVFCSSDEFAMAVMMAAKRQGKRVPEDIKIVGYDGIKIAQNLGITTIVQPIEDMGFAAFELLLKQIRQEANIDSRVFSVRLKEGMTT